MAPTKIVRYVITIEPIASDETLVATVLEPVEDIDIPCCVIELIFVTICIDKRDKLFKMSTN